MVGVIENAVRHTSTTPALIAVLLLTPLTANLAYSQRIEVLSENAKAVVTQVEISQGKRYRLADDNGAVWVALDSVVLDNKRQIKAGEAETVPSGEQLSFQTEPGFEARLVIVKPKGKHQPLTIESISLGTSLEDASDRNDTLLVALSDCHFRYTRNLGDESEWKPSRPEVITMKAGDARWIGPGTYHFKNLAPTAAHIVFVEY